MARQPPRVVRITLYQHAEDERRRERSTSSSLILPLQAVSAFYPGSPIPIPFLQLAKQATNQQAVQIANRATVAAVQAAEEADVSVSCAVVVLAKTVEATAAKVAAVAVAKVASMAAAVEARLVMQLVCSLKSEIAIHSTLLTTTHHNIDNSRKDNVEMKENKKRVRWSDSEPQHYATEKDCLVLPVGWTAHNDDNGNTYYYHAESSISSWSLPPPDYDEEDGKGQLEEQLEREKAISGDVNRSYLLKKATAAGVAAASKIQKVYRSFCQRQSEAFSTPTCNILPAGWTAHNDEDGNTYYYQAASGNSTWTLPQHQHQHHQQYSLHRHEPEQIQTQPEPNVAQHHATENDCLVLPTRWTAHNDDDGNTYYYHAESSTSSWYPPGSGPSPKKTFTHPGTGTCHWGVEQAAAP